MNQIGGYEEHNLHNCNEILYSYDDIAGIQWLTYVNAYLSNQHYYIEYYVSESDNESSTGSSISIILNERSKRQSLQTPPPDNFFRKKKMKNDSDMDNFNKLAGALVTISQQMVHSPVQTVQSSQEKENNGDSEVKSFIQLFRILLQRICMQRRISCLIEMLKIMQNFDNS